MELEKIIDNFVLDNLDEYIESLEHSDYEHEYNSEDEITNVDILTYQGYYDCK